MSIKVEDLSQDNFREFGQVVEIPRGQKPTISAEFADYWKQQSIFEIKGKTEMGVLKARKYQMRITQMERHLTTPEILMGLGGSFILPVARPEKLDNAESGPSAPKVKAFKVAAGQAVVVDTGCWHWLPCPAEGNEVAILVIFKDNTSQLDTIIKNLDEAVTI